MNIFGPKKEEKKTRKLFNGLYHKSKALGRRETGYADGPKNLIINLKFEITNFR